MDLKLTEKLALVTGSTAGIGFAIARSLAREGAHVFVNGRTQKRVDAVVAAIRSDAQGGKVEGIVADFSSAAGAESSDCKIAGGGCAGEQCRHLRAEAFCGDLDFAGGGKSGLFLFENKTGAK